VYCTSGSGCRKIIPMLIPANTLFGLLAALFWGGGDFSGGMAAKGGGGSTGAALRVILVSHSASLCTLATLALLRGDAFPHGAPLLWGIAAGITGGLSLTMFYLALARGAMGAAAAISGLLAAAVPAVLTIASEGSPGTLHLAGFAVAGLAIWMVAAAPTGVLESPAIKPAGSTLFLAIVAGAGFGLYFIALKHAGAGGVLWPMATARMGSITTCSVLVLVLSVASRSSAAPVIMTRAAILWALSTALLDTSGNLLFLAATRSGRLDIAAVLASLYPATTILLAGAVLKERLSRRQGIGMAIAGAAVVMITL
jgi:drug/metabolite transporter (DMT)-like permease